MTEADFQSLQGIAKVPYCPWGGKKVYASSSKAMASQPSGRGKAGIYSYHCAHCRGWHTAHKLKERRILPNPPVMEYD